MQQVQPMLAPATPTMLLRTSVFMLNTDRIAEGVWDRVRCQNLLANASVGYQDLYQSLIWYHSAITETSHEDQWSQRELVIRLLTETVGPFLLRWNPVFFHKQKKHRRWVRRKHCREMQADFQAIQTVVAKLCVTLETLDEKIVAEVKGKSDKPAPKRNGMI